MTDATADLAEPPKKKLLLPLILGLVLAIAGGGGGFLAVRMGLIPTGETHVKQETPKKEDKALPDVAFVEIDPIIISLNEGRTTQHLRFRASIEVTSAQENDVAKLKPRIIDVLNGYLRALDLDDLRDPLALTRLRAQMLRRVQIVAGRDRVHDVLIMEFVLN